MTGDKVTIRRVVTGHDANGKAIVVSDGAAPTFQPRPGHQACRIWAAASVPADNLDPADGAALSEGSHLANGVVFRIIRHAAGASSRKHRTQTLDYAVILSGAITLELDDGVAVALRAGDVLVQRGTIHRWTNKGDEPCTMAVVLLDAAPLSFTPGDKGGAP